MVHCPECETPIEREEDIEFVDVDSKMAGLIKSSKRFYVAGCANCGAAIGTGVAGAGH